MEGDQSCANSETDRDHFVHIANFVEVFSQRPRGCVSIIRLDVRAAPGIAAVATSEEFPIAIHDRDHDSIIDKTAQDSAIDLCKEHHARSDFNCIDTSVLGPLMVHRRIRERKLEGETRTVFAQLQVLAQVDGIRDDIVRPCSKVHITNRAVRDHQTRQHFRQVVRRNTIAETGIQQGALEQC